MLSLKKTKKPIPDLTEFTDEHGKKWIQTSADDLFSTKELNEIIEKIEKEKNKDKNDIILAKFDFQQVNKEYYQTVLDLEAKLKKQNEILRNLIIDAKGTIDRKNNKLKELVKYIRKLHLLLAYYKTKPEEIEKLIPSPEAVVYEPLPSPEKYRIESGEEPAEGLIEEAEKIIGYTQVEEILLDEEGNEKKPA